MPTANQGDFMLKQIAFATLGLTLSIGAFAQQDKGTRPSPPAQAQCKFSDGKTITVDYSSPRMKGRKIFGELVPYGQVWRTGANDATTFVTDENLFAAKTSIPAGSYTIFTIPTADKWTLIINKKTGEWGIPYKYESEELARILMSVSKTPAPVENFTISFDHTGGSCTMRLSWENTQASVEFTEKNADVPMKR
jgi:Protein of unknown function (DUF2911)